MKERPSKTIISFNDMYMNLKAKQIIYLNLGENMAIKGCLLNL